MFIGAGHPTYKQVVMVASGDVSLYPPETLGHFSLPFQAMLDGTHGVATGGFTGVFGSCSSGVEKAIRSFWDLHETFGKTGKMIEV